MITGEDLIQCTCAACGTEFAMQKTLHGLRKNDGRTLYCPNGHELKVGPGAVEELGAARQRIAELEKELEDYKTQTRQLKCQLLANQQALDKATKPGLFKRLTRKKTHDQSTGTPTQ